jgi:hypothetical protein
MFRVVNGGVGEDDFPYGIWQRELKTAFFERRQVVLVDLVT